MSFINKIRKGIQRRSLSKLVDKKRNVEAMSFAKAKLIGLLFDASDLDQRQKILAYANQLENKGKKVKLLGFFDSVQTEDSFSFKFYTKKDINWKGLPIKADITSFLDNRFDLFINLNHTTNLQSEAIAAQTDASLKIGPVTDNDHCYDLMIDSRKTLSDFITQLELLLQKTNNSHEPTNV